MVKSLHKLASQKKQAKDYDIEDDREIDSDVEDTVSNDHYVPTSRSKIRLIKPADLDDKYTGLKTSRKGLFDGDSDSHEEEITGSSGNESGESENEDFEGKKVNGKNKGKYSSKQGRENVSGDSEESENLFSGDESDLSDSGDEIVSSKQENIDLEVDLDDLSNSDDEEDHESTELDHQRSKLKEMINSQRKHVVSRLSQSATTDSLKGYAIQQQHSFFDKLIDLRLKLQQALLNANKLPISSTDLKKTGEKLDKDQLNEAKESCYTLLDSIFKLRNNLIKSDSILKSKIPLPKKRSFDDYLQTTLSFDSKLESYRHDILTKWSGKVQNSSGSAALNNTKFKAINQSFDNQVNNNLNDMSRLIKRTKLNRRQIIPLGYEFKEQQQDETNNEDADIPIEKPKQSVEIDEIFDDDDFYRVLLNDLVDKKIQSSNPTTGLTMVNLKSAQKVQKLNKNVDSKATKGRKLKYTVQEPIANLEVPRSSWKWDDNQIDEFFASLLGQKVNMNEDDNNDDNDDELTIDKDSIKLFG